MEAKTFRLVGLILLAIVVGTFAFLFATSGPTPGNILAACFTAGATICAIVSAR